MTPWIRKQWPSFFLLRQTFLLSLVHVHLSQFILLIVLSFVPKIMMYSCFINCYERRRKFNWASSIQPQFFPLNVHVHVFNRLSTLPSVFYIQIFMQNMMHKVWWNIIASEITRSFILLSINFLSEVILEGLLERSSSALSTATKIGKSLCKFSIISFDLVSRTVLPLNK